MNVTVCDVTWNRITEKGKWETYLKIYNKEYVNSEISYLLNFYIFLRL